MESIAALKELEVAETPLLLFDCDLVSGDVERWSTHQVEYEGQVYRARVLRHNAFEVRAGSEDGIDTLSKITLILANADSHFSQITKHVGWKGARLNVRFLFFDLRNGSPASETVVLFSGVANAPEEITEAYLRLSFANRLNLQRVLLPEVRIQRRCPWTFPSDLEQRTEATDGGPRGRCSLFYRCGYSADIEGGVGNLESGKPYSSCDHTRAECEARGMFDQDQRGNPTRRFGGIEYVPPSVLVRGYGEKGYHLAPVIDNEARYNDFVPFVYGTAWLQPPIVFARNDGNLTRLEALLGSGEIEGALKVLVNDTEIPAGKAGSNMTGTGWYNTVTHGGRTGSFNLDQADQGGKPIGDPYGSMAVLSVVVPNRINDARSLPRVQVLLQGSKLDTFEENGSYRGNQFTNNPAWVILDLLRRSGWALDEMDLVSFARAAQRCDELIPARDIYGNEVLIPRFQCNLVVRRRRSAADLIRGIRNSSLLQLTYGFDGKLQLCAEASLAVQQPMRPDGSNSKDTLNGGWPRYEFGEGTSGFSGILRKESGEPSIRLWTRSTADTPNRYSVEFQDEFNEYQQDSLSLVDVDDVIRTGQEISAALSAHGIANFNQAARALKLHLDKSIRGNLYVEFETSVRGVGMRPGDLITVTYLKEGLQRQPFRIVKLSPGTNHRTTVICAQVHDDDWYKDSLSGDGGSEVERRQAGHEVGLPRPLLGKLQDSDGVPVFEISESVTCDSDGSVAVTLSVGFEPPRTAGAARVGIPLVSLAASVEATGGQLAGNQTLYYAVSAVDLAGAETELSFLVRAVVPGNTSTNVVRLTGLRFSQGTVSFNVYRGSNPAQLLRIASEAPLSSEFRDDGIPAELLGPPDPNYDHARFYWRLEMVPPQTATSYSANAIGCASLQMTANEYAGMTVRILRGKGTGQERSILSHDEHSFMVAPRWDIEPDATSMFVVAESSWHFGAASSSSPAKFDVPNREAATVHVSGRSANTHGRESPYELSPLTRWRIGGSVGMALDGDVAGAPTFGLTTAGQGSVELVSVGFEELSNTRTVVAGTLTLHYWDELASPSRIVLNSPVGESAELIELSQAGGAAEGTLIQIASEILTVEEVLEGGRRYRVSRGCFGTAPVVHSAASPVWHLSRKAFVVPFAKDFFGSPASGSYSYPIHLPAVRIAAAELFVTNVRGNSETSRRNFTSTAEAGLRTLIGGQLCLQVEGHLAIQSDAAPPLIMDSYCAVRDVFAVVREAPTGGPVELQVQHDGEVYCNLTIPADSTVSNVVNGFGMPPLREKAAISLHVLSVPQAADATPGQDLTVTIRL